ncbi:MAG: type II secretion system protein GspL [Gammaproteobacteria bacterium]
MKRLIFTWSPESAACDWLLLDANGNREGAARRGDELSALHEAALGCELVWLAPGAELLAVSASLPVKGREKLARALPYALEEQFAEEPGSLFFALPAETTGAATQAIAVDIEWLRAALDKLAAAGLAPARVLPDYLALPWASGSWSVLADAGMLYVRTDLANGFTLEADTGWAILARRLAGQTEAERPETLRYIRGREPHGPQPEIEILHADAELTNDGLLGIVPEGFARIAPINLLQGPFKPGSEWQKILRPWRPAAAALAAVVVLALIGFVASWVQNSQADKKLNQLVQQRYHQLLPGQPWFGNATARRMVQRQLQQNAGGGGNDLLSMLAALAAANPGNVTIESLDYRSGALQIRLHAPDVASLEALRAAIASHSGLPVSIHSANQTSSGVEGGLIVGAGASS